MEVHIRQSDDTIQNRIMDSANSHRTDKTKKSDEFGKALAKIKDLVKR